MITNDDLLQIGFVEIPHYTVTNSVVYNLGRGRSLSASCVGTPNEMLWIRKGIDIFCLHNYDYDGYLTIEKVQAIINAITMKV